MYKIQISNTAKKDLVKIDFQILNKLIENIKALENVPNPVGSIKLKGENAYRTRVGNYRIIYEIDSKKKVVIIYRVAHRKDVYKKK